MFPDKICFLGLFPSGNLGTAKFVSNICMPIGSKGSLNEINWTFALGNVKYVKKSRCFSLTISYSREKYMLKSRKKFFQTSSSKFGNERANPQFKILIISID